MERGTNPRDSLFSAGVWAVRGDTRLSRAKGVFALAVAAGYAARTYALGWLSGSWRERLVGSEGDEIRSRGKSHEARECELSGSELDESRDYISRGTAVRRLTAGTPGASARTTVSTALGGVGAGVECVGFYGEVPLFHR